MESYVNEKKTIQNGFEAGRLVPFDPEAIDYNALHKKSKKKKKDEPVQKADLDHEVEGMKKHLLTLKKNLLDIMLKSFRDTEATGVRNADT